MRKGAARVTLALVVCVPALAACGRAIRTIADANPRSDDAAADSARIICEDDAIRIETPVVRAHPDGVHLWFENPGEAWGVDLHFDAWDRGQSEGVELKDGVITSTSSMPPGNVTVACLKTRRDAYFDPGISTATLTVVDPDGLFVPWDPVCGFGRQSRIQIAAGEGVDPAEAFRRVPGVMASDEFRTPLYPESPQYWPTFVVYRDEAAIARIMGPRNDEGWELLVNACPGSGIAGLTRRPPVLERCVTCEDAGLAERNAARGVTGCLRTT